MILFRLTFLYCKREKRHVVLLNTTSVHYNYIPKLLERILNLPSVLPLIVQKLLNCISVVVRKLMKTSAKGIIDTINKQIRI